MGKFDRTKEVNVKIRVQPTETKIEVVGSGSAIVNAAVKSGGYIGFTSFSGNKGTPEASERSDYVELMEMKITNYDTNAKGEDMPSAASMPAPPVVPEAEKEDVLAASSSFRDHRAESDAIKVLTNMVFKLTLETQPIQSQLSSAINSLSERVTVMEKTFDNLKKEIDKKTGHHLGAEFDLIKQELSSLSSVAS